jgi:hypothetical protein
MQGAGHGANHPVLRTFANFYNRMVYKWGICLDELTVDELTVDKLTVCRTFGDGCVGGGDPVFVIAAWVSVRQVVISGSDLGDR